MIEIRVPHQSVVNSLSSYLLLVDRCVHSPSPTDNKQEVNDIEDDEHRYNQVFHKHRQEFDTEQVENKTTRENHKCHYYPQPPYGNNHIGYLLNIDHIEISHDMFENSLELSNN